MIVLHNIFALTSLVAFLSSTAVVPVAALTTPNYARHVELAHNVLKRNNNKKRCKQRPAPQSDSGVYTPQSGGSNPPPQQGGSNPSPPPPPQQGGSNPPPPPPPPPQQGGYTPAPPSGSGKKGVGWPNGPEDLPKWQGLNWIYTWSPYCPDNARSLGIECVPMCWGWNQRDEFIRLTSQPGYASVALGANEPNQAGQADMSPGSGAELWRQAMQPLKAQGYRLGSPATTSAPSGKQWMIDFFNTCPDCSVDFVALHWYDKGVQKFIDYVTDFHNTFGRNIWVTEYACQDFNGGPQCSQGEVWDFLTQTVQWMEATPWVERYAWFGAMHDMQGVNDFDQLMGYDGGRNDLGNAYISTY